MSDPVETSPVLTALVDRYRAGEMVADLAAEAGVRAEVLYREVRHTSGELGRDVRVEHRANRRARSAAPGAESADEPDETLPGPVDAELAASIVSLHAAGVWATRIASHHGVDLAVVHAALAPAYASEVIAGGRGLTRTALRTTAVRARIVERVRAYTDAHPDFALGEAYAAIEHRPSDRGFLRDRLDEVARESGRASARSGALTARRDAEIADAWVGGETYREIAARYSMTSSRVGQVIEALGPEVREAHRAARVADAERAAAEEGARVEAVVARVRERVEASGERLLVVTDELRAETGYAFSDEDAVRAALPDVVVVRRPGRDDGPTFSDEDLLAAVREVAETLGRRPRSREEYDARRDPARHPSGVLLAKRVGWAEALRRSGVDPSVREYRTRPDRVPTERVVAAVRAFLDASPTASLTAYDAYARERGAPSLSSVRSRLGSWTDAVSAALALGPGEAEALLAVETVVPLPDRELTEEEVAAIVADYASGLTPTAIGKARYLARERVREILEEHAPGALARARRRSPHDVTEELAVAAVAEVAAEAGLTHLGSKDYLRLRDPARHPSLGSIHALLPWSAVAARAGVSLDSPRREPSPGEAVAYVAFALYEDPDLDAAGYEAFAARHRDAPRLPVLTRVLGPLDEAVARARLVPRAHALDPDPVEDPS